jgi:hypothetical protein
VNKRLAQGEPIPSVDDVRMELDLCHFPDDWKKILTKNKTFCDPTFFPGPLRGPLLNQPSSPLPEKGSLLLVHKWLYLLSSSQNQLPWPDRRPNLI